MLDVKCWIFSHRGS